jgi:hypothetical protein
MPKQPKKPKIIPSKPKRPLREALDRLGEFFEVLPIVIAEKWQQPPAALEQAANSRSKQKRQTKAKK